MGVSWSWQESEMKHSIFACGSSWDVVRTKRDARKGRIRRAARDDVQGLAVYGHSGLTQANASFPRR